MMKEYQVTVMCASGKYRPISCIIKFESNNLDVKKLKLEGLKKICAKYYWTGADLKRYEYTQVKVREYDREKIEQEKKERYEKIKEEKYASGEWKRPAGARS